MASLNQYISIMFERCQFKSLWKLMIGVLYQVCQLLTITIHVYSFQSTRQYISILLKRCQFKSDWKLQCNLWVYFNICLIMLTALTNLDTSPQLNERFEELLLFQCDFYTTAKMLWNGQHAHLECGSSMGSSPCLVKPKIIKLVRMQH